jgi:hypothetical protein
MDRPWENENYSVVSFYGFVPKECTLRQFYAKALGWFMEFQSPPTRIGTGLSKGLRDFTRVKKKLEGDGFSLARTKHIWIYSEPYDGKDPKNGCNLECAISGSKRDYCLVVFPSRVLRIGSKRLLAIAQELIDLLNPRYGIGFERIGRWGPAYFAVGLGCGLDKTPEEDERVINWRETTWERHYLRGYLGGVFPWNFLTAAQLNARAGAMTLEQWISAKPHRGTLQRLANEMVLWSVPEADIPDVYKALWEAEVVFDYMRYCDRLAQAAPPSPPMSSEEAVSHVLKSFGYQSPDEVQILKVEEPGRTKELSEDEVKRLLSAKKKDK